MKNKFFLALMLTLNSGVAMASNNVPERPGQIPQNFQRVQTDTDEQGGQMPLNQILFESAMESATNVDDMMQGIQAAWNFGRLNLGPESRVPVYFERFCELVFRCVERLGLSMSDFVVRLFDCLDNHFKQLDPGINSHVALRSVFSVLWFGYLKQNNHGVDIVLDIMSRTSPGDLTTPEGRLMSLLFFDAKTLFDFGVTKEVLDEIERNSKFEKWRELIWIFKTLFVYNVKYLREIAFDVFQDTSFTNTYDFLMFFYEQFADQFLDQALVVEMLLNVATKLSTTVSFEQRTFDDFVNLVSRLGYPLAVYLRHRRNNSFLLVVENLTRQAAKFGILSHSLDQARIERLVDVFESSSNDDSSGMTVDKRVNQAVRKFFLETEQNYTQPSASQEEEKGEAGVMHGGGHSMSDQDGDFDDSAFKDAYDDEGYKNFVSNSMNKDSEGAEELNSSFSRKKKEGKKDTNPMQIQDSGSDTEYDSHGEEVKKSYSKKKKRY